MGFQCPVCEDPQADDVHLANHLAFTALVRGGEHETWLDERVPEWGGMDDEELAAVVTEHATETEYPQVFEDTTSEASESNSPNAGDASPESGPTGGGAVEGSRNSPDESAEYEAFGALASELSDADSDREARAILEEARELTRRRRSDDGAVTDDGSDGDTDDDAAAETDTETHSDTDTDTHS